VKRGAYVLLPRPFAAHGSDKVGIQIIRHSPQAIVVALPLDSANVDERLLAFIDSGNGGIDAVRW